MTLSGNANRVFRIKLLHGTRVIRTYRIASDSVTIGSAPECTLKLAGDKSLMPMHATLYQEENEVTVVPESGATVLLNGESVDFGVVEPDDVVKIGRMAFSVELIAAGDSIVPESGRQSRAPAARAFHGGEMARPRKSEADSQPVSGEQVAKVAQVPRGEERVPVKSDETLAYQSDTSGRPVVVKPLMGIRPSGMPERRTTIPPVRPKSQRPTESVQVEGTLPPRASIPVKTKPYETEKTATVSANRGELSESLSIDISDMDFELPEPVPEQKAPVSKEVQKAAPARVDSLQKEADTVELAPFGFSADDYFFDDEDDPEDDEFAFCEPFDLNIALSGQPVEVDKKADLPLESFCGADVVRISNERVAEMEYVRPGRKYRAAFDDLRCTSKGATIELQVDVGILRQAVKNGNDVDLSMLTAKHGRVTLVLKAGDNALLAGKGGTYRIDAYHPPVAPLSSSIGFKNSVFAILGGAIVLHITVGLLAFAVFPEERTQKEIEDEQEFAVVEMEKPEFKKEEEQKPEPKAVEKDATAMAERAPKVSNRAVTRIRERANKATPSSSVSSLLSVLSRGSGKAGKTDNIKDLVSNIDAVGVGSGSAAYNIAGAIASLPGGDVNVAREGGGGAISTLSGEQVAGKGSKIAELTRAKPSGKIRGKVTRMSSGAKVKGSLSKEDISRVVNSNIHAVQACYEKALLRNPGLSGRIVFDWTVKNDGRVSGVRVRSSTLGNSDVSSCISTKIKKWKFPRPKGGEVIITYPFLFRSVSS